MGCCATKDEKDNLEVVLSGRKKCTDPICCIVFIVFWVIFVFIFIFGLIFGNPENIIYGLDYQGNSCGDPEIHPGAKEYNCTAENPCKYVYYPRLSEDASIGLLTNSFVAFGVCLPKCPVANQVVCTYEYQDAYGLPTLDTVQYCKDTDYRNSHSDLCENCWISPLNTTSVMFRCIPMEVSVRDETAVCSIPSSPTDPNDPNYIAANDPRCLARIVTTTVQNVEPTDMDIITTQLSNLMGFFSSIVQDLQNGYVLLIGEAVLAVIFGFIFTAFIACCAKFMIWIILILIILCSIGVTIYCYSRSSVVDLSEGIDWLLNVTSGFIDYNVTEVNVTVNALISTDIFGLNQTPETWSIIAYVFTFVSILVLIIVCALASLVDTSEKIIKETTRGINKMPLLLVCPVFVAIVACIIIFFFIASTVLVVSSNTSLSDASNFILDTITNNIPGTNITLFCRDSVNHEDCTLLPQYLQGSSTFNYIVGFFNLFGLFWSVEFVSGICTMTIAGAIAKWYFTRPNKNGKKPGVGNKTVFESLCTVLRCHLGSIAFGSCCIAIVSVLRSILLYIDKKSKKSNKLFKCFFKCCHCCLWCLEKCLRYLSKNAYILVITRNKNFCSACIKSFNLLFQNIGQVTLLNGITLVFFWLGKLLSAILCGVSCYFIAASLSVFQTGGAAEIYDPIPLAIIAALIGYIIFSFFSIVYDSSIDTILLCYCEDKTYFKEKDQPAFADEELENVINNKSGKKTNKAENKGGEQVEMKQEAPAPSQQ